jgi:hypothetical protein
MIQMGMTDKYSVQAAFFLDNTEIGKLILCGIHPNPRIKKYIFPVNPQQAAAGSHFPCSSTKYQFHLYTSFSDFD